jgi:N-glycosylase/DNA lyase
VDLVRTFLSHGVASLPPMRYLERERVFEVTLRTGGGDVRTVRVSPAASGSARVTVAGSPVDQAAAGRITEALAHILRLDEDLSAFYDMVKDDPELAWAAAGAGRMVRSATVFEEVVKTICTTNCAWSATERMVHAIVGHLGDPAPGAPAGGAWGRAFPTAEAMASAGEAFYEEKARAGYRGRYLAELARRVAQGELDLEILAQASPEDLPDEEVEARLLALPGVGPYAAAHIMMMLGRYRPLILDSWTRPTFIRLAGMKRAKDSTIVRRFRRYGEFAGLAFWLYLTRGWVSDGSPDDRFASPP